MGDYKLMANGRGHHYEFPQDRDEGSIFSFKSGGIGALIGGAFGAAFFSLPVVAELPLIAAVGAGAVGLAPVAIGALVFGAFGLTFGVERNIFKSLFDHTDAQVSGRLFAEPALDIGREQVIGKENLDELAEHRLRRQTESQGLGREYNDRILQGGIKGQLKGSAGGLVLGALVGLAVGALIFGVLAIPAVATFLGLSSVVAAATIIPPFAAAGSLFGMKVFGEAGREAGAESTARAIDDEFEHNQALKAQGIEPPAKAKPEGSWFNLEAAGIMTFVGAAIGVALFPYIGGALAAHGLLAAGASVATQIGISSLICGAVGTTFGFGEKIIGGISHIASSIYYDVYSKKEPGLPDVAPSKAIEKTPSIVPQHKKIELTQAEIKRLESKPEKEFAILPTKTMQDSPAMNR